MAAFNAVHMGILQRASTRNLIQLGDRDQVDVQALLV
jgi:hypothetical protein